MRDYQGRDEVMGSRAILPVRCIVVTKIASILFALLALALLEGCAARGGRVNFETSQHRFLTQVFNQAYITDSGSGEYDIVLVDSPGEQPPKRRKNRPLQPMPLAPLQQVMHIHVYWHALTGIKSNPAAVNASIDWYVLGSGSGDDVVLYEGAGYVVVDESGERREVDIREGDVKPKIIRGNIKDPIGHATLVGYATARMNDARVKDTLAQMQQQIQGQQAASGSN
jgi:hypothetical protein